MSAKKNGLDVSKSTFYRITERDLKQYPYMIDRQIDLSQGCEEGCKSVFKEIVNISNETEISRVH